MPGDRYRVTEAEAIEGLGTPQTHPLNPAARRRAVSLGDLTGLSAIGVHRNVVAPGDWSTEPHRHAFVDEFIYVLAGTARLDLDGEQLTLGSGDFVGLPANGPAHAMKNVGPDDLVYLVGGNRPAYDMVDYPRRAKRLYVSECAAGRRHDFVSLDDIATE